MFEYTNTNFRTQNSFVGQFKKFLEIENKNRDQWLRNPDHKQETDKQRVVKMLQSKLFRKETDGLFKRTNKGNLYSSFIETNFQDEERWLINYIFLLNGYYADRKNYTVYRVKEDLLNCLLSIEDLTVDLLVSLAKSILISENLTQDLRHDFFYIHSFYDDVDFLSVYLKSTASDKEELAKYIENNYRSDSPVCCISKKYKSGNFNHEMLLDETKVFLLTLLFIRSKEPNLNGIYKFFIGNYNAHISTVDEDVLLDYFLANRKVFDPIFAEVLELEENEMLTSGLEVYGDKIIVPAEKDIAEEYIDETSQEGKQRIKAIYVRRKKQALTISNYTCGLEVINDCKEIYFTAKATKKNYLELHHFIPREFRNNFASSIEVLANYVTLCPRCHKQIHLATDRERKPLIHKLLDERKARLEVVGLKIDRNEIYTYYGIDSD
jgi:5-methylcytosine-specific restriction protein A